MNVQMKCINSVEILITADLHTTCYRYMELEEEVVRRMMDLVYELVCQGELMLARILRKKIIEKCEQRQKILADNANTVTPVQSIQLSQK